MQFIDRGYDDPMLPGQPRPMPQAGVQSPRKRLEQMLANSQFGQFQQNPVQNYFGAPGMVRRPMNSGLKP